MRPADSGTPPRILQLLQAVAGPLLPWPGPLAGVRRADLATPTAALRPRIRGSSTWANCPRTGGALARKMAEASIYALPARYEPFGLSALEAALSGCALVLGDIPSLREIWGPAAIYVPADDKVGALRAALDAT